VSTQAGHINARRKHRAFDLKLGFNGRQSHLVVMVPMVPVNYMFRRQVIHVIALINAQDAFNAAYCAADCRSNHRTDRAGDAVALIEAMCGTAGHALRLRGERHRKRYDKHAGDKQILFHEVIPLEVTGIA
jgi:hypothetical protein